MRTRVIVFLLALAGASPASAQARLAPDSLLDRLAGRWVLEGKIGGKATTHDVSATWVLGREYLSIHEVSRERTTAGTPAYEAIVYLMWDPDGRRYACLWLDNTAKAPFAPLGFGAPPATGDRIPLVITTSPTDAIHTTFLYDRASGTWRWEIDNVRSGVARPFARVTLRRR